MRDIGVCRALHRLYVRVCGSQSSAAAFSCREIQTVRCLFLEVPAAKIIIFGCKEGLNTSLRPWGC